MTRIRLFLLGLVLYSVGLGTFGVAQANTRQVFVHTAPLINLATTNYHYGLSGLRAWSTTKGNESTLWEQSGTFANFCVKESVASGSASVSAIYTIHVNGANTSLTVTVTNSTTTTCDVTNTATITAGQTFTIERATSGGTPANSAPTFTLEFVPTTPNAMVYGGVTAAVSNVDAFWNPFINPSTTAGTDTGPNVHSVLAAAGTMTSWNVRLTVTPGVGDTRTFCFIKNAVLQDGNSGTPNTCIAITGNGPTTGSSTVDMTNAAGDVLGIFMDIGGNPDASTVQISWTHVPTTSGTWMIGGSPTGNTSNATEYIGLGENNWSTTEDILITPRATFFFRAVAGEVSAANDGRTLLIRKDGGSPVGGAAGTLAGGGTTVLATGDVEYTSASTWGIRTAGSGVLDLTWGVAGITQDSIATGGGRLLLFGVGK